MKHPQLDQMRLTLAAQGYPPSYISRLCGELEDHYCSIIEERCQVDEDDRQRELALERLGTNSQIVAAIEQSPELAPLFRRFPWFGFALVPGLFLCFFSWAAIQFAYWLAQGGASLSSKPALISGFEFTVLILPSLIAGVLAVKALHLRVHWLLPACATALLSLAGFYHIDLAACAASQGAFFETKWEFAVWQFLSPWIVFLLVTGISQVVTAFRCKTWSGWARALSIRSNSKTLRPIAMVSTVCVMIVMFLGMVEITKQRTTIHPADKLVKSINEPGRFQAIKMQLIACDDVRERLELTPHQASALDQMMASYSEEVAEIGRIWWTENPKWRPMPLEQIKKPLNRASASLDAVLSAHQQTLMNQLAYQSLEWDIVFRKEVRRRLRISHRQLQNLKDLLFEKVKTSNQMTVAIMKAPKQQQVTMRQKMSSIISQFHEQMSAVLTTDQLERLNRLRGDRRLGPDRTTSARFARMLE